jgi:uncharacterized SAM-binding protein YcdF (DUF218 family)
MAPKVDIITGSSSKLSSRARNALYWILAFVMLLGFGYVFRIQLLLGIGNFLVVQDQLERADLILLLNGDVTTRPAYAATLYKQGLAPVILVARAEDSAPVRLGAYPNVTDSCIRVMELLGVPSSKIIQVSFPGGVGHTSDEARALLTYYQAHPFRKVIIVTSDLHSRRAKFTFRRFFARTRVDIMLAPTSDLKYGAHNWWKTEDGVVGCQNEYIKTVYYYFRY